MNISTIALTLAAATALAVPVPTIGSWPAPVAPVVSQADGYVVIPGATVSPDHIRTYRAIFNATLAAEKPTQLVPALNNAGSELNALGACKIPLHHAKFVVVFHGDAIDGILDQAHYRKKFGVDNPNLPVIDEMEKAGVRMLVCGQNLAFAHIDPRTLTPKVEIASDALIVLMTYENAGYALLSF